MSGATRSDSSCPKGASVRASSVARSMLPFRVPRGGRWGRHRRATSLFMTRAPPYLRDRPFPADLDANPGVNNLSAYWAAKDAAVAHVFVNRSGKTFVGHNLRVPWRATKLENRVIGEPSKGLFLHIELIQPRRRDPADMNPRNDRIAPEPGFSAAQYEMLGLLYVVASVRAGAWLVPAFHASIDEEIPGGHDDPQNFRLAEFDRAVQVVLSADGGGGR